MEKIYEENNDKKPKKLSLSIVLSFAVALFAIVSLIAVGFNQISYAVPNDKLTVIPGLYPDPSDPDGKIPAGINGRGDSGALYVPMLFSDSSDASTATKPVFCIEHGIDYSTDADNYQSDGEVFDDLGLVYILNQSKVLGGTGIVEADKKYPGATETLSADDYKAVETYVTQVAIWMYMHEHYPAGDSRHGKLEENTSDGVPMTIIKNNITLKSTRDGNTRAIYSGNLYNEYVKTLVEKAGNASNYKTVKAALKSSNITLNEDKTVYQTDRIDVIANPSSDLVNYSVDLEGIDGAYVVDKNGNRKSSLDTFAPSDYFYIRVPVNKVTNDKSTVTITIVGEFQNYIGGEYFLSSGNAQSMVSVTSENFRIYNSSYINFMAAPDTGMTTAQTIYFIGLIVLLCGVGIIYANAKPVEEN